MEQSNIVSGALKLHHITNLNTYIIKNEDDFVFHNEKESIPEFMPGANEKDILYFYQQISFLDKQLYAYTNEWGLHYLACTFNDYEKYFVIIGPYMELTPDLYQLSRKYNLSNNQSNELRRFCNQIQVLNPDKINSISSILQAFEQIIEVDNKPIRIETVKEGETAQDNRTSPSLVEDGELIKIRYKVEADFIHAVEQGNKSKALNTLYAHEAIFSFSERLPNQPLRRLKNISIVLGTLLRSAAGRRNVPTILIHRTSEKYAHQIENANQVSKLQSIQDAMIEEYSDLIISNSLNKYSKLTQKVIEYLMIFYDKKIDKNELAELCFTHPSHLSRKFKQETSMTITAYQQMLRIEEAKYLLKNENVSVEEIAWLIGYEDSSYFARVFKKETGCTPSQYIENN
ncbi:AraC family transcriptional regulator [Aquibacillus halophilus]|uniref:AraC family transcriptional regulator n=1 Tax=Aquibacillus halophilus TaxID=930132 RepID=A0A6A8DDB1_9BACI|nr:helix-turn-helix domain-containing protein [Aquibacillus halophilus]MRH43230.1 AraC family transcriptional regulator [Aquibacillus halophilus]